MALIYRGPLVEYSDSAKQDFSLFELLTSEHEFMVDGVSIMRKGSPEWDADVAKFRRILEDRRMPQEEVEGIMQRVDNIDVRIEDTPFHAMHYREKRLVYDHDGGLIGELAIARKQIDFFRLAYALVDEAKKARMTESYLYDGSLNDALEEFEKQGYSFNLLDVVWGAYMIQGGKRTVHIAHITPIENLSIDDVIKFGSQRQR